MLVIYIVCPMCGKEFKIERDILFADAWITCIYCGAGFPIKYNFELAASVAERSN